MRMPPPAPLLAALLLAAGPLAAQQWSGNGG